MTYPQQLAVFPLPIFLLPNGRTRLRIFEPRYVRMVKESAGEDGFVLSLLNSDEQFSSSSWGAWVKLIDFETLPDGMLGITVEAQQLVTLSDFYYQQDKLLNATVSPLEHWHGSNVGDFLCQQSSEQVKQSYIELLEQQRQLSDLYPELKTDDLSWFVARWLEVLPLDFEMRKRLTAKASFELALKTVETIILGK